MMVRFAWLVLLGLLVGCSPEKAMHSMMVSGEEQRAERVINDVARGRQLAPVLVNAEIASHAAPVLPALRAQLPPPPIKLHLLQYNVRVSGGRVSAATYELSGNGRFALAQVITRTRGRTSEIVGFQAQRIDGPAASQNAFTLTDKPIGHYVMLLAMVSAIGITIAALVRIWRSGRFRRRWLWTIGALIGVGSLTMNWKTGDWTFQPLMFNLLSAGFFKQPTFAPWLLKVGFPLVAIVALLTKRDPLEKGQETG